MTDTATLFAKTINDDKIDLHNDNNNYNITIKHLLYNLNKNDIKELNICASFFLESNNMCYTTFNGFTNLKELNLNNIDRNINDYVKPFTFINSNKDLIQLNTDYDNIKFSNDINYLNNYKIKKLDNKLFSDLNKLECLNLHNNDLNKISRKTLSHLINLKKLTLSKNKLASLYDNNFENLHYLEELYLNDNNLYEIGDNYFNGLNNLKILDLSNNYLYNISGESFFMLNNIETIKINNNMLSSLNEDIFKNTVLLKFLDISNNKITKLDNNIFKTITLLEKLDMSNNKLIRITHDTFKFNTELSILKINNNNIVSLSEDIFDNTPLLKILDVSYNILENMPDGIFTNTQILVDLNISNNNLTDLPYSITTLRLRSFTCYNNELDIINPITRRWYDRILYLYNTQNRSSIYNDPQNVHNHDINNGIKKSIEYICCRKIKYNKDEILNNIINNKNIKDKCKELLLEYINDETIHTVMNVSFGDVFFMSYDLIEKHELYTILNQEMLDGECKCFTGRLNRYINIFNGVIKECTFVLNDATVFGSLFSHLRKKYSDDKEKIMDELLERKYEKEYIDEWLEYLE